MNIKKAIIPAAGLGTRFLPYTKSVPKELLPVLGVPGIQMIVEEAIASEITNFYIIANDDKVAIKQHFSHQPHLEQTLEERGKINLLDSINIIIDTADFTYIAQKEQLGLGHAILMAKNAIDNEYFAILLPDEIMICDIAALQQLRILAQKYNASIIAVQEVPADKVSSYGIVAIQEQLEDGVFVVSQLVEKPAVGSAPSNLAIIGRYVLSPRIFDSLETITPGAGGEYQLTDAIADMMHKGERVIACTIKGIRHDIGNPIGWLQANIDCALRNPLYASAIAEYCKKRINIL